MAQPGQPSFPGGPDRSRPGPWDNDVLVYRVAPGREPEKLATFKRAGVPTVARLKDGRLLAAFQSFPEDDNRNFDRVAVRFSSDEGRTWTKPEPIVVEGIEAGLARPFDPTLVLLQDGRVRLYFTSNRSADFHRSTPQIYSAISTDGTHYTFEPGVRFGLEGRIVIDCAVAWHEGTFHLIVPDNGTAADWAVGQQRGQPTAAGTGYHAVSRDGLKFERVADVKLPSKRDRWLGNMQSDGGRLAFFGTGPGPWPVTSGDGVRWEAAVAAHRVPGADPGAVRLGDGSWLLLVTSEPRPGSPSALQRGNARGQPSGESLNPRSGQRSRPPGLERNGDAPATPRLISVNAGEVTGHIRSLLGVNRGPLVWPREPGAKTTSLVESYRHFGIDFIRTHDFYGPTDWQVIFPRWDADAEAASSYDFRASDERIRAIVDNGFGCFFRLGTSWKGRRLEPTNDPPGTKRDSAGRVTHPADRDDFKKWAVTCTQTVRHYAEGWKDGFKYPIEYWEIWNEPDLAAQFWTGTPEQYYALYEEAARAVKTVNPKFKVGGPACTGGLREAYVERFIRYCAERNVPLDFFSWHSYGGRDEFNPHQFRRDAERIRHALDAVGFKQTENIITEWNAGIQQRLFSGTARGAAFYASTLACLLDAGVDRAFQYCGDQHPGLGLHEMDTGQPKICAFAFAAWKQLLETPERVAATGSDARGYNVIAGKSADNRRVQVLVSDYQSADRGFRLRLENLPWPADAKVSVKRWLLDAEHRFSLVEEGRESGNEIAIERPFQSESVCLVELQVEAGEPTRAGGAISRQSSAVSPEASRRRAAEPLPMPREMASVTALSYPIVDTSQTKCYDNRGETAPPKLGQPFYGQDAQFQGNAASHTLSADGLTVRDNVTGLTWQSSPDTDGNTVLDRADKLSFPQAQALPAKLNAARFGGFDDWRLPTIKELYSLFDGRGTDPSGPTMDADTSGLTPFLDTKCFKFVYGNVTGERVIDSQYASCTKYVGKGARGFDKLFGVNFADGRIKGYDLFMPGGRTGKTFFVMCVRGNPSYGTNDFHVNGDGTITDRATGLMWSSSDSGKGLNWQTALAWVQQKNAEKLLGHDDWRLPNVKELQSIVDYSRSPDTSHSAAIDPAFTCTTITNEAGAVDYPFYWSSTTHGGLRGGAAAMYVAFGRAAGWMSARARAGGLPERRGGPDGPAGGVQPGGPSGDYNYVDVHGAGSQRSDPKNGDPALFPHGRGPQGDVIRIYNYVRLVRGGTTPARGESTLSQPGR